ncbi:type II toxin-antitoxin system RelE/ParE family toxin [Listeria sp. FSL L7-1582]|uniref:type II toxin-antitoxin system RelE/ParE family toxin n=1 Tax=Listeria portnoyi TaxID=2713504 RepID=UPI00164ECA9E|nr:type II toxin-antitoxin system RelE/ParE family toxin [Listeria portnoyi]MBC6310360.1 type II toxin-antitoxin system RelE/ParE family toxin [Listeria portnoyi]
MSSTLRIEWSDAFKEDIAAILHYFEYQYCSVSQKDKLYQKLEKLEARLRIFPLMGVALRDPKYKREYRKMRIGKAYLVFYEVCEGTQKVILHRILAQEQNYDVLIRENIPIYNDKKQ